MSENFAISHLWCPSPLYTDALQQECSNLLQYKHQNIHDRSLFESISFAWKNHNPSTFRALQSVLQARTFLKSEVCQVLRGWVTRENESPIFFSRMDEVFNYLTFPYNDEVVKESNETISFLDFYRDIGRGVSLGGEDLGRVLFSLKENSMNQGGDMSLANDFGINFAARFDLFYHCRNDDIKTTCEKIDRLLKELEKEYDSTKFHELLDFLPEIKKYENPKNAFDYKKEQESFRSRLAYFYKPCKSGVDEE